MPRRSRRTRRPRRRKRRSGPSITKLLKNKTVAKLKYVTTVTLDAAAATMDSHLFHANGMFDPDIGTVGGVSHQHLMYDEYSALYGNYRVLSSKIKITPYEAGVADATPSLYGVYLDQDTTLSYTDGLAIIEDMRNRGSWGIAGHSDAGYGNPTGKSVVKTSSFNARILGPEGAKNSNATSTDPGATNFDAYFRIWTSGFGDVDNPSPQSFLVELVSVVEFTQPIHVAQS